MLVSLKVLTVIDPPWTNVEPIRIGPMRGTLPTPDRYVIGQVGADERQLRIDVYFDPDEYNFEVAAQEWNHLVAVAAGESLYLVNQIDKTTVRHNLRGYFCEFAVAEDQLFVASAEQILAVGPAGELLWRSEELGIDGVVIHEVASETIRGAGELDPPGGWESFLISRQSGIRVR